MIDNPFTCSNCGATLPAKRSAAGTQKPCPACGAVLAVPSEGAGLSAELIAEFGLLTERLDRLQRENEQIRDELDRLKSRQLGKDHRRLSERDQQVQGEVVTAQGSTGSRESSRKMCNHGSDMLCMDCAAEYDHPRDCQCYYCVPYR